MIILKVIYRGSIGCHGLSAGARFVGPLPVGATETGAPTGDLRREGLGVDPAKPAGAYVVSYNLQYDIGTPAILHSLIKQTHCIYSMWPRVDRTTITPTTSSPAGGAQ